MLFLLIAVFAPTPAIRVVAILGGLSIPVFGAPQMAAVYGYSDPTVAAGTRYGWFFGAAGLALATCALSLAAYPRLSRGVAESL